jgi:cyclic 2,3-diphosphoglycerate synthetase
MNTESLLRFQEEGYHAASDYFEDAITGGCITIGCRRCGGGMAGKPYFTVAEEGARLAEENPEIDVVVLEGSGTSFPEVLTDRDILMVSAGQDVSGVAGYLGPYRIMGADLVVVGGCDPPIAAPDRISTMVRTVRELNPRTALATVVFRPNPLEAVCGARVFYASTAPRAIVPLLIEHLERHFGCRVTGWSNSLSDQEKLMEDLRGSGADADVFLTELKASAVSTVAVEGVRRGKKVVFCDNVPMVTEDRDVHDLKSAVLALLRRTGKGRY